MNHHMEVSILSDSRYITLVSRISYLNHYRWAFASSTFLYPTVYRPPCGFLLHITHSRWESL